MHHEGKIHSGFFVFFLASVPASFAFGFEVIINTDYQNQPDFRPFGAKNGWLGPDPRMQVLSTDNDFGGQTCTNYPLPSEDAVKNHWRIKGGVDFVGLESFTGLIYDNLECWYPETSRVNDYETLTGWYKEAIPNGKIGYNGVVPLPVWCPSAGTGDESDVQWKADNEIMQPVSNAVDIFYPSFYTWDNNQEGWKSCLIAYIDEVRRIGGGKPVYPLTNPRYAPNASDGLAFELVPKDYFRFQLDTIKAAGADGVVIWGGDNSNTEWSEDLPWWQATKEFLGW